MTPADAFLRACTLDVQVRKPGNVSLASPGHGMRAQQFVDAAQAAVGPLTAHGARVGARIEGAVRASLAAAGCNANLGIVLLAAPIAAAAEQPGTGAGAASLRAALEATLQRLDIDDAAAAYRAIAAAQPGGLGRLPSHDVREPPALPLRDAMALAAPRDRIAAQYANGFDDLFRIGLPRCAAGLGPGVVERVYLGYLAAFADSHILRKHGEAVAQTVMSAAQRFEADPSRVGGAEWAAWDAGLKARGLNPGTSADLTVATLMLALLWHGS